jgi:SAM-dependent methyltransferase
MNITHVDDGALTWAIDSFGIQTYIDIGCGPGGMVEHAMTRGLDCLGVDGDPLVERNIVDNFVLHDYAVAAYVPDRAFDLAWSCEFVEHVDEIYVDNYMATFGQARHVIMTYAPPGTVGHHHVNCREADYWIDVFTRHGFEHDAKRTQHLRAASTMKRNFVRDTGLYFRNLKTL